MNAKIFCEKCGAEMIDRSEGGSILVECPNCGWGWATTDYDPAMDDDTEYEIWLRPGNTQSTEAMRLIADIASVNFLQARRMLSSEEPVMLYKAGSEVAPSQSKVKRMLNIVKSLKERNIAFFIVPDFPYSN